MEERYKLEKDYTIPYDIFRDAYRDFQKIYVFPKSRIKTILFTIAVFIPVILRLTVFSDSSTIPVYFCYILFVVLIALAFKSWYDPNKVRENLVKSVQTLGEPVYRIGIGEGFVDISTISDDHSNDIEYEDGEENEEVIDDPLPEKTHITVTDKFRLHEYDQYFLIVPDTSMLYILPKKGLSESELETVREITNETVNAAADTFKTEN